MKKIGSMVLVMLLAVVFCVQAAAAERFQLKGYPENQAEGTFVLHPCLNIEINGNAFSIVNNNRKANGEPNVVWYITNDQLEKTPYLVVDIANAGTEDMGPGVHIWAYWLNRSGQKYFVRSAKANNLSGVQCYNLKEGMKEAGGSDTYGLNLNIATVYDPNDGTSLDPLRFNEVYLTDTPPASVESTTTTTKTDTTTTTVTSTTTSESTQSTTTTTTVKEATTTTSTGTTVDNGSQTTSSTVAPPVQGDVSENSWTIVLWIGIGVVVVGGVAGAGWYCLKKRKG